MARFLRLLLLTALVSLMGSFLVVGNASAAPTVKASTAGATVSSSAKHITIPRGYVYNPHARKDRTLHDYCSYSPDEFPAPGTNANFRGSCARHDMCIQYHTHKRSTCDANLLNHMLAECRWTYGKWWFFTDPRRRPCELTAHIYWAVVRTKTAFS